MVDQLTIQTIGVLVTASSVLLYILNLLISSSREERNKRIVLSNTILQMMTSKENTLIFAELQNLQWSDFKDFQSKYDSTVNPENYANRGTLWAQYEHLGYLLKNGLLDKELLYVNGGMQVIFNWAKFKPIIDEYRRLAYGRDWGKYFEYLANEMWKMKHEGDPELLRDETAGVDVAKVFQQV